MGFFRPTFAEINLKSLLHNLKITKSLLPANGRVLAMIKADAYGHGAVAVARALEHQDIAGFGVATVEEGLELRNTGIKGPIIVMGGLMGMGSPASGMMVAAELTPVVHSAQVLELLEAVAMAAGKTIGIHLKIDTGMTRLGVMPAAVQNLLNTLKACKHIRLEGVMTHFAAADEEKYTASQMKTFKEVAAEIEKNFGAVKIWHTANSTAIMDQKFVVTNPSADAVTWVRPGLMLFGAYPSPRFKDKIALEPVMSLKSHVALIKSVAEGTKVSYGCTYTTKRNTRLGVIPIGYADGYPFSLSNKGMALVGGHKVPVVGRVTMDMIMLDITDAPANVGDEVVLLGRQGKESIVVEEIVKNTGSISYEFFCGISKRMPRVYIE